ncbi:MAG: RNase P subunit p30 family protein [Nanoarchaeota archaeon]
MYTDFLLPNNNEEELIQFSGKLNLKNLYFLYDLDSFLIKTKDKKVLKKAKDNKINLDFGIIANFNNLDKAKKLSKIVFIKPGENLRTIIEKKKTTAIFNVENETINDSMHYKNSGLNHILAKIMHQNNIYLVFSFSHILKSKNKEKLIGKIMQNIKLAQKYNVNTIIASFATNIFEMRNPKDLIAFFNTIKMDQKKSKESLSFFKEK